MSSPTCRTADAARERGADVGVAEFETGPLDVRPLGLHLGLRLGALRVRAIELGLRGGAAPLERADALERRLGELQLRACAREVGLGEVERGLELLPLKLE